MPLDPGFLLSLPQCVDPREAAAWSDYREWALRHSHPHPLLRISRQCGRCDSFAIRLAQLPGDEFGIVCADCKYAIVQPLTRAYWAWKRFVQPQDPMLDWKIQDGVVVYFERPRTCQD